jgi:hypothetical protein
MSEVDVPGCIETLLFCSAIVERHQSLDWPVQSGGVTTQESYDRNWVTESERGGVSWRLSRPAINSRKERYAYVEQ